jgi:NitT/TauT family transport system substrate-binding protein
MATARGAKACAALLAAAAAAAAGGEPPPPAAGAGVHRLEPAGTYEPKDGIVDLELSEYAGYAGLIAANGGLEPSDASWFATKHGFRVRIRLSEEDSWSALNAGRMAATASTVDVLAVYGRQLDVVVPAQISWSRGADAVLVRSGVRTVNALRGRTIAAAPFNESDFFLRYLAQEAGVETRALRGPGDAPDPARLNVLYFPDAFAAGDAFLADLKRPGVTLTGVATWEPKVSEVLEKSGGLARALAGNANLLVVADVLLVNGGFARAHPGIVGGLVDGLLEGNRLLREHRDENLAVVAKALAWSEEDARDGLRKVHLSNLPENAAFFAGAADAGGSYAGIYWSAALCYGKELVPDPPDPARFHDPAPLRAAEASGRFHGQQAAIAPVGPAARPALEGEPLLSREIRFVFESAADRPDEAAKAENDAAVRAVLRLLEVGTGSFVRLRGFVDNAEWERAGRPGGTFQDYAGDLSARRARALSGLLAARGVDASRLESVGTRWVQNVASRAVPQNRRVEVEWFALE